MPKVKYIDKQFRQSSLDLIDLANQIIEEYATQGFTLTLRQLYYQLVARDHLENSQRVYKRLGSILNDARLAGLVDWLAIEDRTRNLRANTHWGSPDEILYDCARWYMLDRWAEQPHYVECWVEKDALIGIVGQVCTRWDVPYFSCRGYSSASEMWRAATRIEERYDGGQWPIILHLGDHDPSGIDMSRDITERLERLCGGSLFELVRLALNMNQIEQYHPPPNFAKLSDSRITTYAAQFGYDSWELDALEPTVLAGLIETAIWEHCDISLLQESRRRENEHTRLLKRVAAHISEGGETWLEQNGH